jgi:arginine/ornithine N-succinyltransferase beta subunit
MSSLVLDFSLFDVDPVAATTPGAKLAADGVLTLPLEGALCDPLLGLSHSPLKGVVQRGEANALVVLTVGGHVDVQAVFLHVCIIPCAGGYVKPFFHFFRTLRARSQARAVKATAT